MAERFVIQNTRQAGKTWTMMSEVHDLYLGCHQEDVVLVFSNHEWLYNWTRMWRDRYGSTQFPDYVVLPNFLAVRGKLYRHVFVDDVDLSEDGIWSDAFKFDMFRPETITFTATTVEDQTAHSDYVPQHQKAGTNALLKARLMQKRSEG